MTRPMRRKDRETSAEEALALLDSAEYGVLSTVGTDGQPYGVPLSYVYRDGRLYFHCAGSGRKLENIAHEPRVSFCVVGDTRVLPDLFATEYESAMVFGEASAVSGAERRQGLVWLLEKYCPDFMEEGLRYIESQDAATRLFRIDVQQISGKARR